MKTSIVCRETSQALIFKGDISSFCKSCSTERHISPVTEQTEAKFKVPHLPKNGKKNKNNVKVLQDYSQKDK